MGNIRNRKFGLTLKLKQSSKDCKPLLTLRSLLLGRIKLQGFNVDHINVLFLQGHKMTYMPYIGIFFY